MRRQYNRIYRRLFNGLSDYPFRFGPWPAPFYDVGKNIEEAIDSLEAADDLRPDAKLFLLTNFAYMLYAPVMEYQTEYEDGNPSIIGSQLNQTIQEDIKTIIREARKDRQRNQRISSHEILNAVSRVWDNLKSTNYRIWGADEDQ